MDRSISGEQIKLTVDVPFLRGVISTCQAVVIRFSGFVVMEGGICSRSGSTKGPSRSAFVMSLIDGWNRTAGKTQFVGKNWGKNIFRKTNTYEVTIT